MSYFINLLQTFLGIKTDTQSTVTIANSIVESTPKIEKLRIKIIKNKIEEICQARRHREANDPNGYDVKESIMAISDYEEIALKIKVNTAEKYIKTLKINIAYARENCTFSGKHNGGKGTYASLQHTFTAWYEEEDLMYYSVSALLNIIAKQNSEKATVA